MDSGVARRPIVDMDGYVSRLKGRLDPVSDWLQSIFEAVRAEPKRVVFADGEAAAVIRAANSYHSNGFGIPLLIGDEDAIRRGFHEAGIKLRPEFEIVDASRSTLTEEFAEHLYSAPAAQRSSAARLRANGQERS